MRSKTLRRSRPQAGFTLTELVVVVGIIAIMSAVSLPAIGRYLKNYRIRGAAQDLAGEVGAARNKAITRNTNLGVLFVTQSSSTYRWIIQDDPTVPGIQQPYSTLITTAAQLGPLRGLPDGIVFDNTGATTLAVGFNRLGGQCTPGTRGCGSLTGAPASNFVKVDANGQATLTLLQSDTGLRRTVVVSSGGRVQAQP
jgi:prepilin-type N-terminal cleavage/methylation domain-containing protein